MSEKYFPSNGTDGAIFMDNYCYECYKEKNCSILFNALVNNKEPKQWIYGDDGYPTCTSFKSIEDRRKDIREKNKPDMSGITTLF